MRSKKVITFALLVFVAVSVAYMIVAETRGENAETAPSSEAISAVGGAETTAANASTSNPSPDKTETSKIVVYYFHGNARCVTCREIEARSHEAVQAGFADALKDGRVEWRLVNIEEPANEHFVQDFQLSTRSLVLERVVNGERKDWKNLERVWELVRGDKAEFIRYVQGEITAFEAAS